MKLRIEGMYNITGRGWILTFSDRRLSSMEVPCGSTVTAGGKVFTVRGVERSKYGEGWYSPSMGILLSPGDHVRESFHEGQEIEIEIKAKEK